MVLLLGFLRKFLLRLAQGEPDFAAAINLEDLHRNLVALMQDVFDPANALIRDLRNMQEAVGPRKNLDEGAELNDFADGAVIDTANLGLGGDRLNRRDRALHRVAVG